MEELIGTIKLFAGEFAPRGYMFCYRQILKQNDYQALFSVLGYTYGGNGTTSFALPDLRSRVPVGVGEGNGLSNYQLGENKGAENNQILNTNIPALGGIANLGNLSGTASGTIATSTNISIPVPFSTSANSTTPENCVTTGDITNTTELYATSATPGKFMKPLTANLPISFNANFPVTISGGTANVLVNTSSPQTPLNNLQPSLGLNYIICVQGFYPDRNRRILLNTDKEIILHNYYTYVDFISVGKCSEKKKTVRISNPFNNEKYFVNPIIEVINTENYNDVFTITFCSNSAIVKEYFDVIVYRLDGDSWGQNLQLKVIYNLREK